MWNMNPLMQTEGYHCDLQQGGLKSQVVDLVGVAPDVGVIQTFGTIVPA